MATKAPDRLTDPDDHYPYKADAAAAVLADNPSMGPDGPDDDRARAQDFTSQQIIYASAAYVDAQAEYLKDRGAGTRAAYESAKADLVAARAAHRANRPAGPTVVGIRARRQDEV